MAEYLTPKQVAERLRVSVRTLANWRMKKRRKGPPYTKDGRGVSYRLDLFEAWRETNTVYPA